MKWQDRVVAAHTAVTDQVSRYRRMKSDRYFVWQEDNGEILYAEGGQGERVIRGTTDLFTRIPDDPWIEELEASLTAARIAWYRNSTQYEEETGIIHTEWVWEVPYGKP